MIPLRSNERIYSRTFVTGGLIAVNVIIFLYQATLSYYRLNQVDKDGKSALSDVVTINNGNAARGYTISAFPNPVKDNLSVLINGNLYGHLQVVVTDMQGRVVLSRQWTKTQSALRASLPTGGLQSGLYQLVLVGSDGNKQTSGFVKY